MPDATLEDITAEVERLVKEHMYTDPLAAFPDVVRVRDRIYRLLELDQYPRQVTQLYYLSSVMCALLGDMSLGLGLPRASLEQARASWAYAEIIGHNSLRYWARKAEAGLAMQDNRPLRALSIMESARQWATQPNTQASFYNATALYLAMSSQPNEARTALAINEKLS